MFWPRVVVCLAIAVGTSTAGADISLKSMEEGAQPRSSKLTLTIRNSASNLGTTVVLEYPGSCRTVSESGKSETMLTNEDSSVVAFNFQPGIEVNDCVALVQLSGGRLLQLPDVGGDVAQAITIPRFRINPACFRVIAVTNRQLSLEYYERYPQSKTLVFRVDVTITLEGKLLVGPLKAESLPK